MRTGKIDPEDFMLGGGGLLGRIRPESRIARSVFDLSIIMVTWVPLLLLSLSEGTAVSGNVEFPFLADPMPYARLLIAIPLMILADTVVNRRLAIVVKYIWLSGVLPADERSRFNEAVDDLGRWRDSSVVDAALLAIAFIYAVVFNLKAIDSGYSDWAVLSSAAGSHPSKAGLYYIMVSTPIYQYLLFRWLWRVILWAKFLWRFSRLKLSLLPTHPDKAGGLGIMEIGQTAFLILVFAMSTVLSSNLAGRMISNDSDLFRGAPVIIIFTLLCMTLITGPLFAFSEKLLSAKHRGLEEYGDLADGLFRAFGNKWVGLGDSEQRNLLGSADPSSLSDYGYSYEVVESMRFIPFSRNGLMITVIMALVPFVPLLLLEYSLKEILEQLLGVIG